MNEQPGNIYDYPVYYDLIFGSDWKAEYDFLLDCFEVYGNGEVQRLFEPACGTGRLLYRLAKDGYQVSGLDLNPRAIEYCNQRLTRHGLEPTAFVGDMTQFRLPRKAHAAFNMINSFRHLTTHRQAVNHLRCMARALTKGGLYLLGLHLTPTSVAPCEEEAWSAQRGQLCVNTHMQTVERNLPERVERFRMHYEIYTPTRHEKIVDELVFRTYLASEFQELLDEVGEFEVAAIHDFRYDTEVHVELDDAAEDVVFVLRRC